METIPEFLDMLVGNANERRSISRKINEVSDKIREGYHLKDLKIQGLPERFKEFIFDLARSRIRAEGKFSLGNEVWLDSYSASYSTPEIAGKYRAGRIKNRSIVDLGAGAGMQSVFFSEINDVIAVEIDPVRSRLAKLNAIAYERKGISIKNEDVFSFIGGRKDDFDVIFSDPLRTAGDSEKTMDSLVPNPLKILEKCDISKTDFAFDLPPLFPENNLRIGGEHEYISINGLLNRFTLYSEGLSHSRRTAVMLPQNIIIRGEKQDLRFEETGKPMRYLFLPDPALLHAGLVQQVYDVSGFKLFSMDTRRLVLTGDILPKTSGTGEIYSVIETSNNANLKEEIEKLEPGKIIPRFAIESDSYYDYVRKLSNPLWVGESIYLFRKDGIFCLARKIENKKN